MDTRSRLGHRYRPRVQIFGIDFTSRPGSRKPIVVACARLRGRALRIEALQRFSCFDAFETWLAASGPWVGGFDFPFGLPRAFVDSHTPARDWEGLVRWVGGLTRDEFCAATWPAFRAAKGAPELKHRRVDALAASHSPLKTMDPVRRQAVNPPVGLMFYEGAPRLAAAGLHLPGLRENGDPRIALETYPGWVAARLGVRHYKNDTPAHGSLRRAARERLLDALRDGRSLLPVGLAQPVAQAAVDDASGDALDAALCAVVAAWAARQGAPRYGLPTCDAVEGWIAGVPG